MGTDDGHRGNYELYLRYIEPAQQTRYERLLAAARPHGGFEEADWHAILRPIFWYPYPLSFTEYGMSEMAPDFGASPREMERMLGLLERAGIIEIDREADSRVALRPPHQALSPAEQERAWRRCLSDAILSRADVAELGFGYDVQMAVADVRSAIDLMARGTDDGSALVAGPDRQGIELLHALTATGNVVGHPDALGYALSDACRARWLGQGEWEHDETLLEARLKPGWSERFASMVFDAGNVRYCQYGEFITPVVQEARDWMWNLARYERAGHGYGAARQYREALMYAEYSLRRAGVIESGTRSEADRHMNVQFTDAGWDRFQRTLGVPLQRAHAVSAPNGSGVA